MLHSNLGAKANTGLYIAPETLCDEPDFARQLVEENGVDLFIIRTGFNPAESTASLEEAREVADRLGACVVFLVGTWWGEGKQFTSSPMEPVGRLSKGQVVLAHEAHWPMIAPGGDHDKPIRDRIDHLCRRFSPHGICLTHARFKHAADLDSLFLVAGGEFGVAMEQTKLEHRQLKRAIAEIRSELRSMTPTTLEASTSTSDPISFLDALSEQEIIRRWFKFRCNHIYNSLEDLFSQARARHPGVLFGTNAIGPCFSDLSGQNFDLLQNACDFVQPLLCYMDWHVLQTIYAWAELFQISIDGLSKPSALDAASDLFGFARGELTDGDVWPTTPTAPHGQGVAAMVARQLEHLPMSSHCETWPVLAAWGLPRDVIKKTETRVRKFSTGVVFQGTDYLPNSPLQT